ncbi:phosphatidate cytidylyltransferase [Actinomadura barringtoniae]|uniref:Phosphatidate cytidylyltransferase n=1 Tax=Actinomadura barringtoniae TaxID=1427535 RepID=A0A939T5I3_9ACTN|nr:phosphatidate cytidylyltransferase [Actinomadura barringtoniae]MBO2450668.1 phosphatidate cytidylyltransferase [Actinomadura barringtoniae]
MTETLACVSGAFAVSGAAVWWSGRRELIQRWLSWLVIVPLVGGAFWLGPPGAFALAAGVGLVAVLEYGHLLGLRALDRALMGGALVAFPLVAWLAPEHLIRVLFGALLVAGLITLLERDPDRGMNRAYGVVFGLAWLAPLTGLVVLGDLAPPLCAAVAVADVAAWCGGKLLRGPALSPHSPAKRWGGVAGGAAGGIAILVAFGAATPATVLAVAVGAPLGDLLESMLKRSRGVKDAGSWLPGFGGLLDRIDSLLITLAVAVVLS